MTTTKQAKTSRIPKMVMTPELITALRQAYACCREIGSRNQSDYEIQSMQAAEQIRTTLSAVGSDPEAADPYRFRA